MYHTCAHISQWLTLPKNLCAKHTLTLIVTLNFEVMPTLFLVSMPVHYHPMTSIATYAICCYVLNMCQQ